MTEGRGDPRLRPFRVGTLAIYLVFSVGFSALVIYSVFKSVLEMTPGATRSGPEVYTREQCVRGARAMLEELEAQRKTYATAPAERADHRFLEFRIDWLARKRRLESGCGLAQADRGELRAAFGSLDRLLDLYTTASVQFAGSIGADLDRLQQRLERLEAPLEGDQHH